MPTLISSARQALRALPYLAKELNRRVSLRTGTVLTTPVVYYVIPTAHCNLECTFCSVYKETGQILELETTLRIVREAKQLSGSGFNISLSGGEPMIYKPLYDVLALAHELGVNFGFTTNGLGLTKSNCQQILSHDPFNVNVSLESVDPRINESLRPMKDGTKRTLQGIENLLGEKERSGSRVTIIVKPTIMEQNYRDLPALVRHFGKTTKVQVHLQPYTGEPNMPFWIKDLNALRGTLNELCGLRQQGYPVILNNKQFEGFMEYFANAHAAGRLRHLDLRGHKRNCDIGLRTMTINRKGDVYFCDFLGSPIGNVHKQSLSEIYYGAVARQQRRKMVYCSIDCQQTCKRPIPLWVKARAFLRMG